MDAVVIQKAGEIIPQVVRGSKPMPRKGTETRFHFPKTCPSCGAPVERLGRRASPITAPIRHRVCPDQLRRMAAALRMPIAMRWIISENLGEKLIDIFSLLRRSWLVKSLRRFAIASMRPTLVETGADGQKSRPII